MNEFISEDSRKSTDQPKKVWRKKEVEDSYQAPSFENAACLDCRYLPICMGQCPRNHINHVAGCKMESFDIRIDEGIINYIDKSYAGINR